MKYEVERQPRQEGRHECNPHIITNLRWTARIWSGLLAMLVVMVSNTPDPYAVKPIPFGEMVELGFYGLALLGLILAWRWEILGGVIVLIGVLGNNNTFGFFRGYWFHSLSIPSLLFGLTVDGVIFAFAQTLAYYSSKLLPVLLLYSPD